MKKMSALLLILALSLFAFGCGEDDEKAKIKRVELDGIDVSDGTSEACNFGIYQFEAFFDNPEDNIKDLCSDVTYPDEVFVRLRCDDLSSDARSFAWDVDTEDYPFGEYFILLTLDSDEGKDTYEFPLTVVDCNPPD